MLGKPRTVAGLVRIVLHDFDVGHGARLVSRSRCYTRLVFASKDPCLEPRANFCFKSCGTVTLLRQSIQILFNESIVRRSRLECGLGGGSRNNKMLNKHRAYYVCTEDLGG